MGDHEQMLEFRAEYSKTNQENIVFYTLSDYSRLFTFSDISSGR